MRHQTLLVNAGLFLSCCVALAGHSEERPRESQWLPALSLGSGLITEKLSGSVTSSARPSAADSTRALLPYVSLDGELMTPALTLLPGRPRLFIHGGAGVAFDSDRRLALEGNPGPLVFPSISGLTPIAAVKGQGSSTRSKLEPLLVTAGAGLSFEFSLWGRALRLKPSFEYFRQEMKITSLLSSAETLQPNGICPCRSVSLAATDKQVSHGIGPGLELELDAARAGPVALTLFVSTQAYRLLNGRTLHAHREGTWTTGQPASVTGEARLAPWVYRAGVGLRLRWAPE